MIPPEVLGFGQRSMSVNYRDSNHRRRYRTPLRCCAFAAAVVLLVPLVPWPSAAMVVPAVSPFVAIATAIATRSVGLATLIGLPVLILVLLRRRWLCRWLCPVGLLTECAGRLSGVSAAACKPIPPVGKWLVLVSIAAASVGYPLFLWLDPLAVFSGSFGLFRDPLAPAGRVAAGALAGVLVLSALLPGAWCLKLCPLGATQELLSAPARALFRERNGPATSPGVEAPVAGSLPRRSVLAMAVGAACVGSGALLGWTVRAKGQGRTTSVLRPPGAVDAARYYQLCLRCGACARACPVGIIRSRWDSETVLAWLTPEVWIEEDYCREDCCACMQVCPSGAIARGDLDRKRQSPIGLAVVDMDRCLLALDQECRAMCLEECPYAAISLNEWTWEDPQRYPIVEAAKCPGCGACVLACTPIDAMAILPPGVSPRASDPGGGEIGLFTM